MRIFILAVMLLTVTVLVRADEGAPGTGRGQIVTKDQTKQFAEDFLRVLVNGRVFDAFQVIKAANPDAEAEIESRRQTTETMLDQAHQVFGKSLAPELLDTKSLGESLVRYDYLFKLEKGVLHFRIIFYKPMNRWIPLDLFFNDNLQQLFDDLGK
ncbi:MAG TPA: hypothetical protein VHD56_19295 [Tepidisphaeraceae bacterium]|nr:hypothetical protein [Tepidisphaeraceae bacterium]